MANTVRLTTGQAVVRFLMNQWSERDGREQRLIGASCGIFGHGNLSGLGQGFAQEGAAIPFYQPFHEQSMVHMAVGYARARRRLATLVCTASIGPGTANMYTGAAGATVQRVPVLLLTSDHYASRRQGVVLQQLEHATNFDLSVADGFRAVSAFYDKISRPEQIIPSLLEAMRVLTSPAETGAVTISICQDTQTEAIDYPEEFFAKRVWHVDRRPPEQVQVDRVLALLCKSTRPLLISGGGVYYSEGESELRAFAEKFGIPVVETVAGRSTMQAESPMAMGALGIAGNVAANELAAQADVVLAVGTRLTDVVTCSQTLFRNPAVKFASINLTGRDAIKMSAEYMLADARVGLQALTQAAHDAGLAPNVAWNKERERVAREWSARVEPTLVPRSGAQMTQAQALRIVNDAARGDSYVVSAAGSLPGDINKLWDSRNSKRVHLEFGFSCMTYEIPSALGLCLAGERNVYVCIGDGTYLMNPSDLLVAVRENMKLTICIFDNKGYQIIRDLQRLTTGAGFSTEFRGRDNEGQLNGPYMTIDLAANAKSLGANEQRVNTPEALEAALQAADAAPGVNVIVIEVAPHAMSVGTKHTFWDIAPPSVARNAEIGELRRAYEQRRAETQRHFL